MLSRPPAQPNASLISGLECLKVIAAEGAPLGVREMARRLDMDPTRAHRLMKTLASEGYLTQDAAGKYESGPAMHVLSAQALRGSGLLAATVPVLDGLKTFESVIALGMLWRDEVVYLLHTRPGENIKDSLAREPLFPATRSSIGLSLLSRWSEDSVKSLYDGRDIPGFADLKSLNVELKRIRRTGHAVVLFKPGVYSVGVALDDHSAIALGSLPASQIERAAKALVVVRDRIVLARG